MDKKDINVTLFFRHGIDALFNITEEKRKEGGGEFISSPSPLHSIHPEMLDTYKGERDHIYVNKVLRQPYHQTMSHQPMNVNDWIEIDADYKQDLKAKENLIKTQGKVVLDLIDDENVRLGCQELMQNISDWITKRYPNLFQWQSSSLILNKVTGETLSLKDQSNEKYKSGIEALQVVSKLVQDDFLIASPLPDGHWLCAGGLVCFPGFYLLSEKIGTTLFATHSPVPQFNEKILLSVERTLTRLQPNAPIERTSWEVVDSKEDQFWVPMAGPLPISTGAKPIYPHHFTGRDLNATKYEDASKLILRLDHQTFTKMPKSGIVFFGVHPFRRQMSDLRHSPLLPRLLLEIHRTGPKDLMKYKAAPQYQDSVIPYLEELDRWQTSVGLAKEDDRVQDFRLCKERKAVL